MKSAMVPIAPGVEEMEAVIIIDVFRRAGWNVVAVGLDASVVSASRGVRLVPDSAWAAVSPCEFDVLAFPGGLKGSVALQNDERVLDVVKHFQVAGKLIGAICAAPLILHKAGILSHRKFTSHPSVRRQLPESGWVDAAVVVDSNIVTGQGAGTSFEFALTMVRQAGEPTAAKEISKAICLPN